MVSDLSALAQTGAIATDRIAPRAGQPSTAEERFEGHACGFALEDGSAGAYNEEAFQYFLEIERRRAEISNRPFLLMLIEFQRHAGVHPEIDAKVAAKLFSVLAESVRETDFIGWYREGRVAGTVLTQHGHPDQVHLSEVVRHRIAGALEKVLPPERVGALQVRIYELPPQAVSGRE